MDRRGTIEGGGPTDPPEVLRPTSPIARQLIEATVRVIDAEGEVAVRVQDVVAAAGVPVPVLYRHFGSREGLVQAAQVDRLTRDLASELGQLTEALDAITDEAGFREFIETILTLTASPERRPWRARRVSVLGSTYGRPALAAEVAQLQRESVEAIAALLRRPQELGWLREGLDLLAFSAWFGGHLLGRVMIELGDTGIDEQAYNAIAAEAVRHALLR